MSQLFRTKSIDALIEASQEPEKRLRRTLGPWTLTAFGVGAVIGSGIFTLTGTAAAGTVIPTKSILEATVIDLILNGTHAASQLGRPGAGPAITVSFALVALACLFAGLCYAELSSMIPIAGSAYTYAYAILGEIVAWIIGWDLILEYAVSNMSVAVGFSAYIQDLCDNLFGAHLPQALAYPPIPAPGGPAGIFNIPALLITLLVTVVLVRGVRESAEANTTMVLIKIGAILLFCLGSARAINSSNWHPFAPHGFPGILTGASIVFFTYIGFDSVSTAAEECRNPQKDLPFGIIATLIVCTILYGSVSLVLTGIAKYSTLTTASPVADALKALGYNRLRVVVTAGALAGMISSLLVYQYGQARIWFAMSRDRLLPGFFSAVHRRFQTPHISTWIAGFLVGIPAGIWDIDTFAELSNIGTLFAFALVSAGVIVLRKKQPDRPRAFRVPFVPLFPMISIACCVVLMMGLPLRTWFRFFAWLIVGLAIYFPFGRKRSTLNVETAKPQPAA
ncbi:MAG TPA: amino acid permease [Bryobacteraceae bacterium]|nr:amino acid permease [Bryobacteraceae bacterium]